jgi:hypothetical protein
VVLGYGDATVVVMRNDAAVSRTALNSALRGRPEDAR